MSIRSIRQKGMKAAKSGGSKEEVKPAHQPPPRGSVSAPCAMQTRPLRPRRQVRLGEKKVDALVAEVVGEVEEEARGKAKEVLSL